MDGRFTRPAAAFFRVLHDLERPPVTDAIKEFAEAARNMRKNLAAADGLYYQRQKKALFLDALAIYCAAIRKLSEALAVAS